jgi:exodeoxyribonuclease V gamma subunit
VRAFFRQRLGVSFTDRVDDIDDALPIDLDGLGRWNIGDRMLTGRLAGVPEAACQAAELARGDLPPGALGAAILGRVAPVVERLVHVAARYQPPAPTDGPASGDHGSASRSTDVAVDLGGGDVVVGTVTGLAGPVALVVTYSSVRARQRLAAWVRLLALSAAEPSVAWTAVTIGPRQQAVAVATVGPLPGDATGRGAAARAHLRVLVDLYRRGMDQPLPLYCETSAAWANAVRAGRNPVAAARAEWQTDPGRPDWRREDEDADHRWALDGVADFDDLTGDPVRPDEDGPGWADDQPTRLGRYALRLWGGLLTHERIEAV